MAQTTAKSPLGCGIQGTLTYCPGPANGEKMRYKAFRFENYKGIEAMDLSLTGDVTTLIGLNESGKTTILEAIFCFSYGAEDLDALDPGMASLREPETWIPIADRANFNKDIVISATVELSKADKAGLTAALLSQHGLVVNSIPDEIVVTEAHTFENSRFIETNRRWRLAVTGCTGKQTKPRRYYTNTQPEWTTSVNYLKDRLPRIWYFPNFLFELPERFILGDDGVELADEERDRNELYKSTFEQVLSASNTGAELKTHVVARLHSDEKGDKTSLSALLLGMGRLLTTTIYEGWDRIFGKAPAAQEVEILAEPGPNEAAYLALRIKGPDGYYDLSERSLGFRWFFMFLMMTSFHKEPIDGQRSLFLLDEPASNLHSSAQAELLKSFESLLDKRALIYTTHSHYLINVRWLDSAYVVKNASLGSLDFTDYVTTRMGAHTSISAAPYRKFVAEHPDQTSYFQPVLDLLDYRPSFLEPTPDVVMVEGKSDFYLLRYAADVLGLKCDLHLVPGTGASSLDTVIRLHIGWGKSFVVLLDGDSEGKKQKTRYEQSFGPILNGRCFLLPEVCGDVAVKEAENLLSKVDTKALVDAVFPSGMPRPAPKKAVRQAVVELFARREAVPLEAATMQRLEQLISALSQALAADAAT